MQFKTQAKLSQRVLSRAIDAIDIAKSKLFKELERMDHLRAAINYPQSKQWLVYRPSTFTHQDIDNRNFIARMTYHCGKPLVTEKDECRRLRCTAKIDAMGDHMLTCRYPVSDRNHPHSTRHNRVIKILTKWLNKAGYSSKEELFNPELGTRDIPDITVKEGENTFSIIEVHFTTIPPSVKDRDRPTMAAAVKTKKYEDYV